MPNVTKNKHPFTVVVNKKLLAQANKARKALNRKWPEVIHEKLESLVEEHDRAKHKDLVRRKKDDLGF